MRASGMLMADETLFRDDEVFNPDYMPEAFRYRDPQIKEMAYALKPAVRGNRASNMLIVGPPATGKTTAVRLVFGDLLESTNKVLVLHLNCHLQSSIYKIFSELHKKIFGIAPPDTGVPLTKIQEKIFTRLARDKRSVVIALDDINYLLANSTVNDVLYTILRAHEVYPNVRTAVFAVATEDFVHMLDDRVRSIFSPVRVEFSEYTRTEMFDILKMRRDAGLKHGVLSDSLLQKIASHSRDLRFGIELIKQSALAAEADSSKRIDQNHMEKALEKMAPRKEKDGLLEIIRKHGPVESGELYEIVKKKNKVSYTTFYRMLQRLRASRKIKIEPVVKKKGKTSVITAVA